MYLSGLLYELNFMKQNTWHIIAATEMLTIIIIDKELRPRGKINGMLLYQALYILLVSLNFLF